MKIIFLCVYELAAIQYGRINPFFRLRFVMRMYQLDYVVQFLSNYEDVKKINLKRHFNFFFK